MTKVFIVILNWNRANDTIDCLRSISKLKIKDCDLTTVVVDNGSTDTSLSEIKKYVGQKPGYEFVVNKSNLGFAAGNNVGMKYAIKNEANYVMLLNNDTLVDRNIITEFLKVMEEDESIGAASPKIYFAPGFEFHKDRYNKRVLGKVIWYAGGKIDWDNVYGLTRGVDEVDTGKYDKIIQTDYATGACLFLRAEALKKCGYFDERYYLYYEDTELSRRLVSRGWKVVYIPEGLVWHKVSQSSGIGSDLNDYFITRNRLLFGMKYAPIRAKLALIKESVKFVFTGRNWQKVGVLDFYNGNFGKGSWK